jgi:ribosomal-protein-alanine N-acetyltransferase
MRQQMIRLVGDRLMLREWRLGEAEDMHRWLGDPDVMSFLSFGTTDLEETRDRLGVALGEQSLADRTRYWLAVELAEGARVIGDAGLTIEEGSDGLRTGACGWFLERAYWGQGYGTEAARLVVSLAFDTLGLDRIRASCDADNAASEGIMRKCGMTLVREVPRVSRPGRRRHYELVRAHRLR